MSIVVQSLSCVWFFAIPWTVAHQAPLSFGFPRQEYWGRFPCPTPGYLPNPGIELASLFFYFFYFKTLFLQSQSRSVGGKKCKSYSCIFGNSKHLEKTRTYSWIKGSTLLTCTLKQGWSFLSNIPKSYNMIQYAIAHLKVLGSEGNEHRMPPHFNSLLYNAVFALDKSSICVALHSTKTFLILWV